MVRETDYLNIGYIAAAHGIKGEVFIRLAAGKADWLEHFEELRLSKNTQISDLALNSVKPHKNGLIASLKGVSDRNTAEDLVGYQAVIPAHVLTAAPGEKPYLFELLDFEITEDGVRIGRIARFESNGMQDLLVVEDAEGKEHLIPFVKEFVNTLDFNARKLDMRLPPGLLGI